MNACDAFFRDTLRILEREENRIVLIDATTHLLQSRLIIWSAQNIVQTIVYVPCLFTYENIFSRVQGGADRVIEIMEEDPYFIKIGKEAKITGGGTYEENTGFTLARDVMKQLGKEYWLNNQNDHFTPQGRQEFLDIIQTVVKPILPDFSFDVIRDFQESEEGS